MTSDEQIKQLTSLAGRLGSTCTRLMQDGAALREVVEKQGVRITELANDARLNASLLRRVEAHGITTRGQITALNALMQRVHEVHPETAPIPEKRGPGPCDHYDDEEMKCNIFNLPKHTDDKGNCHASAACSGRQAQETCPFCGGVGHDPDSMENCEDCGGTGHVTKT